MACSFRSVAFISFLVAAVLSPAAAAQGTTIQVPPPTGADADSIYEILREAEETAASATTIQFQAGTYKVDLESLTIGNHFRLANLTDVTFAGVQAPDGSPLTTVVFEGFDPSLHGGAGAFWLGGFVFDSLQGVEVRGFQIQAKRPLVSEGQLTRVAPPTPQNSIGTITVRITDQRMFLPVGAWPAATKDPLFSLEVLYPVFGSASPHYRQAMTSGVLHNPDVVGMSVTESSGQQTVVIDIETKVPGQGTWPASRLHDLEAYVNTPAEGPLTMVIAHQSQAAWAAMGLRFLNCEDVYIHDCRIQSMNQGLSIEHGGKTSLCEHVTVEPLDPNWMVGAIRGGFGGIYGVRGCHVFRDFTVVGGFDDAIDLTGYMWAKIARIVAVDEVDLVSVRDDGNGSFHMDYGLEPDSWGSGSLRQGDLIEFHAPDLGSVRGTGTIDSLTSPAPPYVGNVAEGPWRVKLRASLPAGVQVGDAVALKGNIFDGALVEGCTFTGGHGTGVMVAGPNVTVRNCVFTNLASAAIRAHAIFDPSAADAPLNVVGPAVTSFTVENNVIIGCNRNVVDGDSWPWDRRGHWRNALGAIDVSTLYTVGFGVFRAPNTHGYLVIIRENTIRDTGRAGICVSSCSWAAVDSNHFTDVGNEFAGTNAPENSMVYLAECDSVFVVNNRATAGSQTKTLREGPNVTNLVVAGNSW